MARAVLALLLPAACLAAGRVEVVKSWSAVVTEGDAAKLACKASSPIQGCVWRQARGGLELDSWRTYSRRDNEEVTVGSTGQSREDNMCFLTIRTSRREYAGDWECELQGECTQEDFTPSGSVDFNRDDAFAGRRRRQADGRRRGDCSNSAVAGLHVRVVGEEELSVLPAQDTYHANLDSVVVLTVRTNEPFDRCTVSRGRDTKIEIAGSARREECVTVGAGREATRACATVTQGVPSCLLTLDRAVASVAGSWSFQIEREVRQGRPRTLRQSVDVAVVLVELPTLLYLKYDGVEYRGGRDDVIVAKVGDRAIFQCIAEGGVPRPKLELYLSSRNESGIQRVCRSPNRNSLCGGFEVELAGEHDSQLVTCVARMPGVDREDSAQGGPASQLVYNGLEASVPLSLGYKARLVNPSDRYDNTSVTICDTGLCEGRDYEIVVQFEASPEPTEVEWAMRANDNRRQTVVRGGARRGSYDAERLQDISSRRQPDRYEARVLMERVALEDMQASTEHRLAVTNSAGTTTFSISVDTDRACQCRGSSSGSSTSGSSCSGRDCQSGTQSSRPGSSSGSVGALQPLLSSCLALGASLLETHEPDGSQRPSRQQERDFEAKVDDFYRAATCSGYGRDIFDLYQLKKQEKQQRTQPLTHDLVFTKLDPTGGVQVLKTKSSGEVPGVGAELLGAAKDIVAKAEDLEVQEKVKDQAEDDTSQPTK